MKSYITYEYWNPLTNTVFYVGAGLRRRANWHLWESRKVMRGSMPTGNKHKINTIVMLLRRGTIPIIKIVLEGDRDAAFQKEIELIKHYGRADQGLGSLTNLNDGGYEGNYGMKMSVEVRRRLSEMRCGNKNAFYGKHHTEQNKKRQSMLRSADYIGKANPFYGKKHSEISRKKISECRKTKLESGEIIPGKHTEAHKQYLSVKNMGAANPAAGEYIVTNPEGKEFLIKCLSEWCQNNGFSRNTFNNIIKSGVPPNRGVAKGWMIRKN